MRTPARAAGVLLAGLFVLAAPAWAKQVTWLGVYTQEITPELREGMDYNGPGVLVSRVVDGSPADRGGLERGDVIVRVGTKSVNSPSALTETIHALPAGKPVDIEIVRESSKRAMKVTLESRSDEPDEVVPAPPARPRHPVPPREDGDFSFELPDFGPGMFEGRGRLGVRIETLNPDLASYFGTRDLKGALVLDVTDESPADQAGIRAGDVITKLGEKPIEDADDLIEAVRSTEGKVSISLTRHGAKQTVQATLEPIRKTMRIRRAPHGFQWKSDDGDWQGYMLRDGKEMKEYKLPKRIVIDGDEDSDLKQEIDRLREEVDKLRQELRSGSGEK